MESRFIKGIITAIAYYAAGALMAFLTYKFFGHGYAHAPRLHYLILFASWAGGCLWAIVSIYKRLTGADVAYYRGTALVNLAVVAIAFLWFYRERQAFKRVSPDEKAPQAITTEFSGDTAIVRHDGNIVFLRIGDSVYLDELRKIYPPDSVLNNP